VGAWLYILKCADGSFYTGTTRSDLEKRIGEHQSGLLGGYTAKRRPVALAYAQHFDLIADAIAAERQIKGWSRVKKSGADRRRFCRAPRGGQAERLVLNTLRRGALILRDAGCARSSG